MGPNVVSWYLQAGQGTEILQRQKRLKCADVICHMFTRHKEIMPYFRGFFWLLWITKISSVKLHSCRCSFSGKVLALAASCRLKGNTVKTCCFLPFCTQTALHSWSYYKGFQLFANIGNTNVLHLDKEVQTPDLTLGLGLEGRGFFQGVLINQICLMEVITVENLVLLRYF